MLHVQWTPLKYWIFVWIWLTSLQFSTSSLRLFQSRLPLYFNEFVRNLCDLVDGSSQSILILKSYSTTFLVKRSHIYGRFKWYIILHSSTISFCKFARVHQVPPYYHNYELLSLHLLSFYLWNYQLLYCKTAISKGNTWNLTSRPYSGIIWLSFC